MLTQCDPGQSSETMWELSWVDPLHIIVISRTDLQTYRVFIANYLPAPIPSGSRSKVNIIGKHLYTVRFACCFYPPCLVVTITFPYLTTPSELWAVSYYEVTDLVEVDVRSCQDEAREEADWVRIPDILPALRHLQTASITQPQLSVWPRN